ncbi:Rieske (2Fe-2S) protein [Nocardioides humilatus]|uniref:Cytochrome bc1 complex Rieske iron-sulfur subunit n=1 Tax=Nocardioides humilatus TaxID=2607660 RepID=A0A5B1L943_9ACTN|nr:Rieske (2Fe-2S) protein [Nocardioides humilatus]KAA1417105.1 Rieske (2Fe-2S) protein [Nocardioides humilatus]
MSAPVTDVRATRRIVFQGLGALGVAAVLAGCAGGDDSADKEIASGTELTTTDQVPVQGGIVLVDQKVVVTQPTAGEFKAFTAVCTHQGLLVGEVQNGVIHCDNHGSEFDFSTGAVAQGPASQPLAEVAIEVKGDKVLKA